MFGFVQKNITPLYIELLDTIKNSGIKTSTTTELLNVNTTLLNPRNRIILSSGRKQSLKYICAELLWYLSGKKGINFISNYSSMWAKLADKNNEVQSNYGYKIWQQTINTNPKDFIGQSQEQFVLSELEKNPESRRAIIMLNEYPSDYKTMHYTKDFPCTVYLQFLLRDNNLHMITNMRSNDLIFGWCNDVPFFTLLQESITAQLKQTYPNITLGKYYHNAGSMHVYASMQQHFEDQADVAGSECQFPEIEAASFLELRKCIRSNFTQQKNLDYFGQFILKHAGLLHGPQTLLG
jgi:thymidylate synthase